MIKHIKRFIKSPLSKKWFFFETLSISLCARGLVFGLPFKWVKSLLALRPYTASESEHAQEIIKTGEPKAVFAMINTVHRYFPWKNTCLVQAITGKILLKRRGIRSLIAMGLKKEEKGELKAHAWLIHKEGVVTGFDELRVFIAVGYLQ